MRRYCGLLLLCTLSACSDRLLVSGPHDGGTAEGGTLYVLTDAGAFPSRACPPAQTDAGMPSSAVAVWDGYMENPLLSGADAVKIVLQETSAGVLSGSVTFGTAAPPAPVTNSEECYPSDLAWSGMVGMYPSERPVEGVLYPIVEATSSDIRLKVSVYPLFPWTDWCACQVPIPASPEGGWGCLPSLGSSQEVGGPCYVNDWETGFKQEVPCCKLFLCLHPVYCECTASGCAISTVFPWVFDLSVDGDRADGTVPFGSGGGMHFTRTQ